MGTSRQLEEPNEMERTNELQSIYFSTNSAVTRDTTLQSPAATPEGLSS